MKTKVLLVLTGVILIALLTSGCYTVVMIPSSLNQGISDTEEYSDNNYDPLYETDSTSQVINQYYISGGCYYGFDPFYASPYWYNYSYDWRFSSYDPWYWDSWPYYGGRSAYFMYNPGYYYPPGYYSDPYYGWYGTHSSEPYGRRQFDRRDRVLAGHSSNSPVSSASDKAGSSRSVGLSSQPVSLPGSRVRDGKSTSSGERSVKRRSPSSTRTRSPSAARVRSGSSGSSKSRPAGSSTQGRKTSKPSSSRVRSGSSGSTSTGSSSSRSSGSSSSGSSNRSGGRRSR